MFRRIPTRSGDRDGRAQAAAWLGHADGAGPGRRPTAQGPVAIWIGSPSTLAALGLRGGSEVTLEGLAVAIEDRNLADGRADHAMLAFDWRPPASLAELRGTRPGPSVIDQALLAGAEETLEELRRSTPLVQRRLPDGAIVTEPARGVAAGAIVRQTTAGIDQPQLSVHMLVVGVEDAGGRVVPARGDLQLSHDVASEVDAAGAYTLAWELTKQGYSVDGSSTRDELFTVGDRTAGVERSSTRAQLLRAWEDALVVRGRDNLPASYGVLDETEYAERMNRVHELEMALFEPPDIEGGEALGEDRVTAPTGAERVALSTLDPFDELDVIGPQRRRDYLARMQPLAEWLEEMPDDWVAARHAELGPPSAHLDLRAARLTRLIESRVEVAEEELREAHQGGTSFDVRGLERKLAGLRQQAQQLSDEGLHLDGCIDADVLVRSAAYSKEYAIRREYARQLDRSRPDAPEVQRDLPGDIEQQLPIGREPV